MRTGRSKSKNSLMMHDLYAVADIGNGQEVLRIQVEEMNDPNSEDTTNRAYKLTNVNAIKAGVIGSQTGLSASLITQPLSIDTVAQLYAYVKSAEGLQNVNSASSGNASKVVNEDGTPKIVYHGTARADRVGWEFRADRATSGPMAYFTDNEQIAINDG